ncbi:MAG: OsmC family peroxiredoxin [Gemmatimonadetes bacterium]|nr:OsmC family peroxiredoxin [Gemmatimonadota bacterium]
MAAPRTIRLEWTGEGHMFSGGLDQPSAPTTIIDGDGKSAPSPLTTFLLGAASCSSVDIVDILGKKRVVLKKLVVEVTGTRREDMPRRYTAIHFRYRLAGEGLELHHAEHAVQLSMEKYCSAIATLAPDIALTHEVVLA